MTTLFRTNRLRGVGAHIMRVVPLLFSAMLLLQLPACENYNNDTGPINTGDDETTITFSVSVPKEFSPSTYSLSEINEVAVSAVDVLLFEQGTDGAYVSGPHYGIVSGSSPVNVSIRIPDAVGSYDMVVFANCRSEINSVASSLSGQTKSAVLALAGLRKSVAAGNGNGGLIGGSDAGWLTGDGNKTIPMYGETTATVDAGGNATVSGGSVNLIRMLARVNVTNAASDFELTSVYLCNYNNVGRIAPASNWTDDTPSVVSSLQTGVGTAIKYSVPSQVTAFERYIYTFEANAGSADNKENPCVIIGGKYNSGSETFYRVDFYGKKVVTPEPPTPAPDEYLPLLRNHSYNVQINQIGGDGQANITDAYNAKPVNIDYAVEEWNDADITEIKSGSTILGVSQGEFVFTKNAASPAATLTVYTNHSEGWTAEVLYDGDQTNWLTMGAANGAADAKTPVTLSVSSTTVERTAKIKITAGNLVYEVDVIQKNNDVDLTIDNKTSQNLIFAAPASQLPNAQSVELEWLPASSSVYFKIDNITLYKFDNSLLAYDFGQITDGGGSKTISIQPNQNSANSPSTPVKGSPVVNMTANDATVTYTLFNGSVPIPRTLSLKQQVWNFFIVRGSNTSGNLLEGTEKLSFDDANGQTAQPFTLSLPAGSKIEWESNSTLETYFTRPADVSSTGSATYTYNIAPKGALPKGAPTVSGGFKCRVTYQGYSVEKTLNLEQKSEPNVSVTSIDLATAYPMDGGTTHKFTINATGNGAQLYVRLSNSADNDAITSISSPVTISNGKAEVTVTTANNRTVFPSRPTILQKNVGITISAESGGTALPNGTPTLNLITPEYEANSYMVRNGETYYIPVSQISKFKTALQTLPNNDGITYIAENATKAANWFDDTAEFTSSLVWQDVPTSELNLTLTRIGKGIDGFVKVDVGGSATNGNAVVAVMQSGNDNSGNIIRWSWHIWVTSEDPTTGSSSPKFMNRNLGASSGAQGASSDSNDKKVSSLGLYYQWGRKDPFPTPKATSSTAVTEPDIYGAYSSIKKNNITATTAPGGDCIPNPRLSSDGTTAQTNNVDYAVANPHIYYYASGNLWDWYVHGSSGSSYVDQNNNLWGGFWTQAKGKTVFDPCPYGWRVPRIKDAGLNTNASTSAIGSSIGYDWKADNSPWGSSLSGSYSTGTNIGNYGHSWSSVGGWYPAAGRRTFDSGDFGSVGDSGYYWSASPYGTGSINAGNLLFNRGGANTVLNSNRSFGFSVRCVQE